MKVTHERALEAAQALINSHFGNPRNGRTARTCIPAHPDDDDLVITRYIEQQTALLAPRPVRVWLRNHGQDSAHYGELVKIEDYNGEPGNG